MELNEQTKRDVAQARKEFEKGEFITHEQLKEELGLK